MEGETHSECLAPRGRLIINHVSGWGFPWITLGVYSSSVTGDPFAAVSRGAGLPMTTTSSRSLRLKYHTDAYRFVFEALQLAQERLKRTAQDADDESAHISGPELLEGVRELALKKFGMLAKTVFHHWGVKSTDDFGRIVFELIERGEMRKTDRDQLTDFFDVYDFDKALVRDYTIDTDAAFKRSLPPRAASEET